MGLDTKLRPGKFGKPPFLGQGGRGIRGVINRGFSRGPKKRAVSKPILARRKGFLFFQHQKGPLAFPDWIPTKEGFEGPWEIPSTRGWLFQRGLNY